MTLALTLLFIKGENSTVYEYKFTYSYLVNSKHIGSLTIFVILLA